MHEVHLVRAILDMVEKKAAAQNAKSVKLVKIRCNALTSHSGDHVRFSFDIVKKEKSFSKDAALELTEVEPLVRCQKCGHQFETYHLPDECPICKSLKLKPVNPTDMVLLGFEVER